MTAKEIRICENLFNTFDFNHSYIHIGEELFLFHKKRKWAGFIWLKMKVEKINKKERSEVRDLREEMNVPKREW